MRVTCGCIEEFVEELESEASAGRVIRKIVRLRIERVPEQKERVSFQVAFIGTALLGDQRPEELLQFAGTAGRDCRDDEAGTETAEQWRDQVKAVCEKHGLTLRRGQLEIG